MNQGIIQDEINSNSALVTGTELVNTTMSAEVKMPLPRSKAAPRWKGKPKELLAFLDEFEACADASKLDSPQKCKQLIRYVSQDVKDLIEALDDYKKPNWGDLKAELLKLYGSPDKRKQYKPKDLRQIVRKCFKKAIRKEKALDAYLRKFVTIANVLVSSNKIDSDECDRLFWKGFHKKTRSKLRLRLLVTHKDHDRSKPYGRKDVVHIQSVHLSNELIHFISIGYYG